MQDSKINYAKINKTALPYLPAILQRLLPGGKLIGHEYTALNPRRADSHLGSFKVNLMTGRWADFAVRASGSDVTSLVAYLFGLSQADAARRVMQLIGGV